MSVNSLQINLHKHVFSLHAAGFAKKKYLLTSASTTAHYVNVGQNQDMQVQSSRLNFSTLSIVRRLLQLRLLEPACLLCGTFSAKSTACFSWQASKLDSMHEEGWKTLIDVSVCRVLSISQLPYTAHWGLIGCLTAHQLTKAIRTKPISYLYKQAKNKWIL